MPVVLRPTLGPYMSVECFRFLRFGAEETAGRALIVSAGKQRGHSLEAELKGIDPSDEASLTTALAKIFGLDGTRLCIVNQVKKTDTGYEIHVAESACAWGLQSDEPVCAYTLGVAIGVIETITGKRFSGFEKVCSATGNPECVYVLEAL